MVVKEQRPSPLRLEEIDSPRASEERAAWGRERERLLELLAQQQRIAQAGLVTAALAHDTNNELQVMSGTAALALSADDPDEREAALRLIMDRSMVLADTMRAFLAFVKRRDMEEGGDFLLSDVVGQTSGLAHPLAKTHGVSVTWDVVEDARILGELRVANQAVLNLVSNAIRACSENGGRVVVTVSRPSPGLARIVVTDDGPGIVDEVRRSLFRPFATGNEKTGGTGLGLFIVRLAVRRMNGTIRLLTSTKGSTFRIDLPAVE